MADTHKVRRFYRVLAGIVAVFGVVAIVGTLDRIADYGVARIDLYDAVSFLGLLWLTIPMVWIAAHGRAPARWPGFSRAERKSGQPVATTGLLFDPGTRLLDRGGFAVPDTEFGIEMLNDATTPMDFVVDQLVAHAGLAKKEAVQAMLQVHTRGGALLPMPDEAAARDAAARIADAAREANRPLVCRFVDFRPHRDRTVRPEANG